MNTQEFMKLVGIKYPSYISRYIKRGLIDPPTINGAYVFTDNDVLIVSQYLNPIERKLTVPLKLSDLEARVVWLEEFVQTLTGAKQ